MQLISLSLLASLVFLVPSVVLGTPLPNVYKPRAAAATAQSAPHWVAYWDAWVSGEVTPPDPSVISGYNVLILAFLLTSGTADQATQWQSLTAAQRSSTKSSYGAAGIKLMVSAFGSTDTPVSSGANAVTTANNMANWVITYSLDGIDVDFEDFAAINKADGSAENWLISFTQTLRNALPAGQYLITHAPVAPWFSPIYTAGAYTKVDQQVGALIDWYNVQFYNQNDYTTCTSLLTQSGTQYPKSSVFEIASTAGVSLSKIVIGKPGTTADANNGYVDPSVLAGCVSQAKNSGWTAGVSVWQYPHAGSSWITTVRSQSWPVSGSPPPATTTTAAPPATTTPAPPTSTVPSGSKCAGIAPWSSTTTYNGGQQATYSGSLWQAKWWSYNDVPGGAAGVWTNLGAC